MATATAVPERPELNDASPKDTLKSVGWRRTIEDSFARFRAADGTSHVRAFAHGMVLAGIPALITLIALATSSKVGSFRNVLESTLQGLAPGASGRLLSEAFRQGSSAGTVAVIGGIVAAVVSGTFAMMTVERGFNRTYGIARDRSLGQRVVVGLGLTLSSGILLGLAFLLVAAGGSLGDALKSEFAWNNTLVTVFSVARWLLGLLLAFVALTLLYKVAPNRSQPSWKWLQTGTVAATLLWLATTGSLGLYYSLNDKLSETYGPLLGLIALLTWAYATGLSLYLGMALAAQLEAIRGGTPGPRTLRRFNETLPEAERVVRVREEPRDRRARAAIGNDDA